MSATNDSIFGSWKDYFVSQRGARALKFAGVMLLSVLITLPIMWPAESQDFSIEVDWPTHLSQTNPTGIVVFARDTRNSQTAGATIRVWRAVSPGTELARLVETPPLAEVTADSAGAAFVDVPPVDSEARGHHELVIGVECPNGERGWVARTIPVASDLRIAIQTDRPLYQPGQRVHFRGLVVDSKSGSPRSSLETKIEVRNPRDQLLFKADTTTNAAGVVSAELPIAESGDHGEYEITIRSEEVSVTNSFEVRPFQLPRFEATTEIEDVGAWGERPARVGVSAVYFYGSPVPNAPAVIRLEDPSGSVVDSKSGATDENGNFTAEFDLPDVGGSIRAIGIVTSGGHRASSSATLSRATSTAEIEIVPAWHARFSSNEDNDSFAIVTAPDGSPIPEATLELGLPESNGQRQITLSTDSRGIARFTWKPREYRSTITARVSVGERVIQTKNVATPAHSNRRGVTIEPAVVEVGEAFAARVDPYGQPRVLVARSGGEMVWSRTVPASDHTTTINVELDDRALGLTTFSLLGAPAELAMVWVRAKSDELSVAVDPEFPEPGEAAILTASLASKTPVHYGVTAVDEALYALLERSAVPLGVLMRHDFETAAMLESALSTLASTEPEAMRASRFRSKLDAPSLGRGGRDLTRAVLTRESAPVRIPWSILMVLVGLGAAFMAARSLKPEIRKENFTVYRFVALGTSMVVLTIGGFILLTGRDAMLVGGLGVWIAVVSWWLISAAVRNPDIPLGEWAGWNVFVAVMLTNAAMTISPLSDWASIVIGIGLAPALVAFGVEIFLLTFVLYREREYSPAFGLGSLFGLLFLSFGLMFVSGSTMHKEAGVAPMDALRSEEMSAAGRPLMDEQQPKSDDTASPARPGPRVRSWFPETMLWLPSVTAQNGAMTHEFEVPDSITTWRITTWANTDSGQLAQSDTPLVVKMPLFVQLESPTNLTDGDTIEVPVRVVNESSDARSLSLDASATGALRYLGGLPSTVKVEANSQARLTARLAASGNGPGQIQVVAGGSDGDAVRRTIEVLPLGRQVKETRAGIIGEELELQLAIPPEAIENTGSVEVTVYPSIVGQALVGLESMLRTPTGCFEQTSSANYPNVLVMRELQNTRPGDWPTAPGHDAATTWRRALERATELMSVGYQKMLSFRQDDGGFALYPDKQSNVMLTAYGILQLHAMSDVLPGVDPNILREAGAFLRSKQSSDGTWSEWADGIAGGSSIDEDIGQVRANAFIAYALLLTGDAADRQAAVSALSVVQRRLDAVESAQSLALAALALHKAGDSDAAKRAVDRLANTVQNEGNKTYWPADQPTWMGGGAVYADIETTALGTLALLRTNSHAGLLGGAIRFLAESRHPNGGWGTTQATAWALMSLAELPEADGSVNMEVRLDSNLMPLTSVDGHDGILLDVGKGPQPVTTLASAASEGDRIISFQPTGKTAAMASATATWWIPWSQVQGSLSDPLSIRVQSVADATTGASHRISVLVTNQTDSGIGPSIVELPTAPGAIADTATFERWQQDGLIDRFEITPEGIRLYLSGFGARETKSFSYDITPLIRGTYALTTARAWRYYTPTPEAAAGGARLRVR